MASCTVQVIAHRSLQAIGPILRILDDVESLAKATPPVENSASRFGNPAFKTFYDKLLERSQALHESIPGLPKEAICEVSVYFNECWGNRTRIDYGSGMELNFLAWMYVEFCSDAKSSDKKPS